MSILRELPGPVLAAYAFCMVRFSEWCSCADTQAAGVIHRSISLITLPLLDAWELGMRVWEAVATNALDSKASKTAKRPKYRSAPSLSPKDADANRYRMHAEQRKKTLQWQCQGWTEHRQCSKSQQWVKGAKPSNHSGGGH
jgi:hypothetical protein